MTIEEITSQVRRHTHGLLNDGEVVYAVQQALTVQGGISPEDIDRVTVAFRGSELRIEFHLKPSDTLIVDLGEK